MLMGITFELHSDPDVSAFLQFMASHPELRQSDPMSFAGRLDGELLLFPLLLIVHHFYLAYSFSLYY